MKKLHFTLMALLVAGVAHAQFFQRVYGAPNTPEVLESGCNYNAGISISQKGFVMTGHTLNGSTTGLHSVMLTRTSLAGFPVFNNRYAITTQLGTQLDAKARKVISLAGTNGEIAVWGDYFSGAFDPVTPASDRFFLMMTDANGNPQYVRTYSLSTGAVQVEATSITQSTSNPYVLYACGWAADGTGSKDPVVISVDLYSGTLIWGHSYFSNMNPFEWTVEDIVESPYPNPNTFQNDVALVGRFSQQQWGVGQGTYSTVNAGTGLTSSALYLYGDPNYDGGFNAIIVSANPYWNGPGFAIAGYTLAPHFLASEESVLSPGYNTWALKIDPLANVIFSSVLDYSGGYQSDYGYDIIERVNTYGDYEYYVGGYTSWGPFGGEDEVVYKLTYYGYPSGSGSEFTYGGTGDDRVLQLDYFNFGVPTSNVGISMFNTTNGSFPQLGNSDFYHVRAYFNGYTACNFILGDPQYFYGPGLLDVVKQGATNQVFQRALASQVSYMQDALVCTANSVPGGANTRLNANGQDEAEAAAEAGSSVFPNPLTTDNSLLNVRFETVGAGEDIDVEVLNALGQVILRSRQTLVEGQTDLQVDLASNGPLSAGMYMVVIHRGTEVFTHNVSVQ